MIRRRLGVAVTVCAAGVALMAAPAAADAAKPSDYRSEITTIEPDVDGIQVDIIGGDAFIRVVADPGVEVIVEGYRGEPYLRIGPEGGVERNRRSPATYLNEDRYGGGSVPAEFADEVDLDPVWERVGDGHEWIWHDHRTHWMSPEAPPAVSRGDDFGWGGFVPLEVNGESVEVSGLITYERSTPIFAWVGAALLLTAGSLWPATRPHQKNLAAIALVTISTAALAVSVAWWRGLPAETGPSVVPTVLAALALAAAVGAATSRARRHVVAGLASACALGGWVVARFDVLRYPVLPTPTPPPVDRTVTILAIAVSIAAGTAFFRRASSRETASAVKDPPD